MIIFQFIVGIFAAVGVGFILADLWRIPSYKASKAANNLAKKGEKRTSVVEVYLKDFAVRLSGKLKLNEFKRAELESDLQTAGMDISPEMFISNAAVKAIAVGLLSVPLFFIFKLLGLFVIVIAIFMYYRETKSVSRRIKAKRQNIEYELPRLVSSIAKMLKHNRDIVYILESYRETAGPDLKTELDITVADMRSGNTEVALTRLESRIGSTMVSDITRGLIAVTRGNDTDVYWAQLESTGECSTPENEKAFHGASVLFYSHICGGNRTGYAFLNERFILKECISMIRAIKNKKAESYIDIVIMILVFAFILVFTMSAVKMAAVRQDLKYMCGELVECASVNGCVGNEVQKRYEELCEEIGFRPDMSFSAEYFDVSSGKVQLGDTITCTLTYEASLTGFGGELFPLNVTVRVSGLSSIYWK